MRQTQQQVKPKFAVDAKKNAGNYADMEALAKYLQSQSLSQTAFAERLGVSSSQICRWLSGEQKPAFARMIAISRITDGAVPIDAWAHEEAA